MSTRSTGKEHYKYGICLNEDCQMCKEKTVQKIPFRKDFVCPECGQELRECPPPKKKNFLPIIIGAVLLAIIAAVVVIIITRDNSSDAEQVNQVNVEQTEIDSVNQIEAVVEEQTDSIVETEEPVQPEVSSETKNVPKSSGSVDYGKWSGSWKNGKPNGTGTMRYTKEHLIDSRDPQKRVAQSGDYVIGEFVDGKLVQGVWYDSSNNVKGSIIIGM